jgi:two-component system, chemotaxis family, CheB/CheR fusion protein
MTDSDKIVHFGRSTMAPGAPSPDWWHSDLLEHTHDAVIVWELGGKGIIYWNRAAEMLYGYLREEVRGRITHELLKTEISGRMEELEDAIARYGIWAGELRHMTRTGRRVTVETRIVLLPQVDDRWIVAEFNREISGR